LPLQKEQEGGIVSSNAGIERGVGGGEIIMRRKGLEGVGRLENMGVPEAGMVEGEGASFKLKIRVTVPAEHWPDNHWKWLRGGRIMILRRMGVGMYNNATEGVPKSA